MDDATLCGGIVAAVLLILGGLYFSGTKGGQQIATEEVGDMPGSGGIGGVIISGVMLLAFGAGVIYAISEWFKPNSGMVPGGPAESNPEVAVICGGGGLVIFLAFAFLLLVARAIGGGRE